MLYDLATIYDDYERFEGQEVTVRCRVRSGGIPGENKGQKIRYEIDDPRGNLDIPAYLSFWYENPEIPGISKTAEYILGILGGGSGRGDPVLNKGESVLIRATPNISTRNGERELFLNVTSVLVRSPELQIGKGEMAVRSSCPRRYYLTFVKKVYNPRSLNESRFRGNVVHRVAERAVTDSYERFVDQSWTKDDVDSYVDDVLDDEFGIRMAQLVVSGIGLNGRDYAKEALHRLFTSEEFCTRLAAADKSDIVTEQSLADEYGYRGDVDLVIDDTPYDFKTSLHVNADSHARQLKLYLFGLLLERADVGEDVLETIDAVPEGYIVYPNLKETDEVQFESVTLDRSDVKDLLELRNAVADARDPFGPPSPYNRDCEGCRLRDEDELVSSNKSARQERGSLPSACKFHCQTERRWSCYEVTPDGGTTSQCTLFDECEERLEFRDPDKVDHYNELRSALSSEERARRTASDLLDQLDDSVLERSGRLVTGLSFDGASIATARFEIDHPQIPAFTPGDTVLLEPETEGIAAKRVTFLGVDGGMFRFQFDVGQSLQFLRDDVTYRAKKTFEPEHVSRKFLPYLDYAQRRDHNRRFEHEQKTEGSTGENAIDIDEPGEIASHLDNTELFAHVPVRPDRTSILGSLVESTVTAQLPAIPGTSNSTEGTVPEEHQRTLILGATPELVDLAERALPDGAHYRMDNGGTGESAIRESDSYHQIQQRWNESTSLLSSVQYALNTERFHSLVEGAYSDRDHSVRFFDTLVLLGADQVTEPEYLFLSDLADRVVSIGDTHGLGPSMVSPEAVERGLDQSYFSWAYGRYASLPVDNAVSLLFTGETNEFVQSLYPRDTWTDSDTEFSFLEIEGGETIAAEDFEIRTSVRAREGLPQELVFDVSDTTANPFIIQSKLESRDYLDATLLRQGEVVNIDDIPMLLESKRSLDEERNATHHRVVVKTDAAQTPEFTRSFLYNRPEAKIVAQVAEDYDPEFIVTPFETHANELRQRLEEQAVSVPVKLPEQLGAGVAGTAIVSFGVSNDLGILRPPLNQPEMLYRLLSCAEDILLIGHGPTLRSKRDLEELVDQRAEQYTST